MISREEALIEELAEIELGETLDDTKIFIKNDDFVYEKIRNITFMHHYFNIMCTRTS